ncbi:hypothetical protein SAMN05216337_100889 [Bradyrhizobium brasilense]|uniref:Uncharacterized protein n=2 Tax=Bradyrhizobium brasilense TaxID=1419277 RepID=A0A1G6SG30_9BRAD|nr:hypothetical protein [Bradyrhizobium brasilense]SDD15818.1 hypothetical protein SAMN05216337_100889 [Bradyrhizobium brasilense]
MKWMKERDLLIAQTMAFVQSVKGKLPDAELPSPARQTAAAPAAQPTATPPAATPAPAALPIAAEQALAEAVATLSVKAEVRAAVVPPPLPVPTVIEGLPPAPSPLAVTVVEVPPQPAQLPHFARLDISGDFGSEVRERVANFRAQQQRFLKEREEYCTTTMAKVRAAINELPRSGK